MKALAIADARRLARFVTMQNHYNLLYREEEREMIPLCRDQGLGIIPWSPLARGVLVRPPAERTATARGGSDQLTPELYDSPTDADIVNANLRIAKERGVSPAETALAWLLSQPGVTAPIVGVTKLDQLETAARAVGLELTAEERAGLEAPYTPRGIKGWYEGRRL